MKVLLFTLEYPPFKGGVANYYGNMVKYWPASSAGKPAEEIFVLNNNDGALVNDKLPFLKWLPAVWQLWRATKFPPDKGDMGGYHILVGHILPLGAAAFIVKKIKGVNYSIILHGMDLTLALRAGRKRWLTEQILKHASHIICASSYTASMAREAIGEKGAEKVRVVNPGVNRMSNVECRMSNELLNEYNLKDKIVLFSLGRLVKRKGFDKVIEAMPEILKEVPNLVYIIAGTGPDEEYLKELAENGSFVILNPAFAGEESLKGEDITSKGFLTSPASPKRCAGSVRNDKKNTPFIKGGVGGFKEKIIFIGKISDEEKWAWLELCDIFTMPSRQIGDDFEGFGIVYLEAGLAGKPIVAGRSGGVEDAVVDGVTGLLVNPESAEEITNTIIKLAKDRELRKKLGEAGKKRAEEEFSWKKQVKKICYIINKG